MLKQKTISKLLPSIVILSVIIFFGFAFFRGKSIVQKSEKEINPGQVQVESNAKEYVLREIDSKSGLVRWDLSAEESSTENDLQSAIINNIKAHVYKGKEIAFELSAPHAKANSLTKEIYLFGDVTTKDKSGEFVLMSKQISLGMGTSIEAQKGFNLYLKNNGTVIGESALINDDHSKITVTDLKEALFNDIKLSGKNVYIEKDKSSGISIATITNGGTIILKNNDTLTADLIKWKKSGEIEASNNVIYTSGDKLFKAGILTITPDKKVLAKGHVSIKHGDTECYGDSLSYGNDSIITITGNPKAVQGEKEILADKILYDLNLRKVQATGNVRTLVNQKA